MQPKSIKLFDLCFLGSVAISTAGFFVGYDDTLAELHEKTAAAGVDIGGGFITGSFIVGLAISGLLWFLISQKGNAIAKWVLIALFAFGLLSLPGFFTRAMSLATILQLAAMALEAVAIFFLFQPDTKPWFEKGTPK